MRYMLFDGSDEKTNKEVELAGDISSNQADILGTSGVLLIPVARSQKALYKIVNDAHTCFSLLCDEHKRDTIATRASRLFTAITANFEAYNLEFDYKSKNVLLDVIFTLVADAIANGDISRADASVKRLGTCSVLSHAFPDVDAKPMFPNFPSQVENMSGLEYRFHQVLHYMSTYGVEQAVADVFFDGDTDKVNVRNGYLPDVEDTEKTRDDESVHGVLKRRPVTVIATLDGVWEHVTDVLSRKVRASGCELQLAADMIAGGDTIGITGQKVTVGFKENAEQIVRLLIGHGEGVGSDAITAACRILMSNPMDVLKCFSHIVDEQCRHKDSYKVIGTRVRSARKTHISTRVKRGFANALLEYGVDSIVGNLADAHADVRNSVKYMSLKRFCKSDADYGRIMDAVNGKVRSWNSKTESLFSALGDIRGIATGTDTCLTAAKREAEALTLGDVCEHLTERPGVLLRTLTRLVRNGLTVEKAKRFGVIDALAEKASMATLLKMVTQFSVERVDNARIGEDERRKLLEYVTAGYLARGALLKRLAMVPEYAALRSKRVFFDCGRFSDHGSLVIPNDSGEKTSGTPVGMAYAIPHDDAIRRLRFFTFWDNARPRVDVDMHAYGFDENGVQIAHIGWNSSFDESGITTSGDVTTSDNSVEYIDVDVRRALAHGIRYIEIHNKIYNVYDVRCWDDIDTCFCGCTVVGSDETDVRLYDKQNVVYRYDLTGKGHDELTCVIDLHDLYARVYRGECLGLRSAKYTLNDYIADVCMANGISRVYGKENAFEDEDVVIVPLEELTDASEYVEGRVVDWTILGKMFFVS